MLPSPAAAAPPGAGTHGPPWLKRFPGLLLRAAADASLADVAKAGAGNPADKQRILDAEVIEGYTESLGGSHTDTLMAKMNLAILLDEAGDREQARRLYEEVIEGYTESLGGSHTDTLRAKMNLATLLKQAGDREQARRLYEEVIEGYTESLGGPTPIL